MRRTTPLLAVVAGVALTAAACGSSSTSAKTTTTVGFPATTTTAASGALLACQSTVKSQTLNKGVLTVATDSPVYEPWFINNTPSNGRGYESAVAYDVAALLGFDNTHVKWVTQAFSSSYAPGPKKFDFDVKGYLYGDQIGTTGLAYINSQIQPTKQPRVYNTLDQAVSALQTHQIDAIVVDTPDGQYMASQQVKGGVQVGQFPENGEHFGLLFAQNNPLVTCVNTALAQLTADGTLTALSNKYLGIYNSVPKLQP